MENNDYPGIDGKVFKLTVPKRNTNKFLFPEHTDVILEVVSDPVKVDKWWWKILRFVTFGKCFQPYWVYEVKQIKQ